MNERYQQTRKHTTRWTVRAADRLSSFLITLGGVGTIVAVSAVCLFLVAVVIPLVLPGSADEKPSVTLPATGAQPIHISVDEYRVMAWALFRDGSLRVFRMDTGEELAFHQLVDGDSLSAWSISTTGEDVAFGFVDGSVRLGHMEFKTDFPSITALAVDPASLAIGDIRTRGDAVIEKTPEGQLRRQRLVPELYEPIAGVADTTVVLLDHIVQESGSFVGMLDAAGTLRFSRVEQFENLMTGEVEFEVSGGHVGTSFSSDPPGDLMVSQAGTTAYLLWPDGRLARFDTRDIRAPAAAGGVDLTSASGDLTVFETLAGGSTFLVGDSGGGITAWFEYNNPDGSGAFAMADAHHYGRADAGVSALAPSPRSRVFAAGYSNGDVCVYQATSEALVVRFNVEDGVPIQAVAITPKTDGIIALTSHGLHHYDFDVGHPEATLASLFTPVWYEGYAEPNHVWQSSSASDDFEPKLGLWPLVFGTLKATFYSMLFGIPLALLAAIFTSEFMSPVMRPRVKTLIESMASLPSVVLGFLAALVFAPFVQRVVPGTMVGFLTVPGAFLVGAYLWQLLPQSITLRFSQYRLLMLLLLLPLGVGLAAILAPMVERALFGGDMIVWLDGKEGSGLGGWVMLFLPISAFVVVYSMNRFAGPWFRNYATGATRSQVAVMDLTRFAAGAIAAGILAFAAAGVLTAVGADPRGTGSYLDTYVQRNALVVGFVMGFAIIPIIYTIAEDALAAVPNHLRAASLGAGATPWQTAVRIILPTAMSGLFSAVMIGLGRAVGETMIVLMAAGNTPVLEMNLFNGFRTLSANIAVELPEAVRDSTHYRTLFLAALLLFTMTFAINTVAEIVRLRFRKRSAQI